MDHFHYRDDELYVEDVSVANIAHRYGTPCYIYSRATLERHWHVFDNALKNHAHLICYAVKANSNLAILNLLARLGSGFDVVSQGELERVLTAGGDPQKIVFSGVGKTVSEMQHALVSGIYCFNVESFPELEILNEVAQKLERVAPISIRINPNIDAKTHPYISTGLHENKFGIEQIEALRAYEYAATLSNLKIIGIDCHIGSQLTTLEPFLEATDKILQLISQLKERGIHLQHIDLGGGLGVRYDHENPPTPDEFAIAIGKRLENIPLKIIIEPGRAITANAGILVTKVEYVKSTPYKNFVIVDAGMNDLMRPALYDAWHNIIPLALTNTLTNIYDVVGPVCETGDFFGKDRELNVKRGNFLAVRTAGAYGFSMSSNYNSRPRAAEILVDQDKVYLIRRRETFEELFSMESLIP